MSSGRHTTYTTSEVTLKEISPSDPVPFTVSRMQRYEVQILQTYGKSFIYILYTLPSIVRVVKSRRMRWAGHVALMGEGRGVHRVLVGKPEGKRPMGRPRRRWEDNIKMALQEVEGGCGDWMELAQDRDKWWALVNTVMNLRVPKMRGIS